MGMRWSSFAQQTMLSFSWQPILLLTTLPFTQGISLTPAPSTNLDLSSLGRVALAGDFDAIQLYQFLEQRQGASSNGTQSIVASLPDGVFANVASADAHITAMCSFYMKDGTMAGIVVGGNFTSLGGVDAQAVAMVNPDTAEVTPLPGIQGQVAALLCDQDTNSVYVGGSFRAANSTNAIAWVGTQGWANLAFAGFNGPVSSITKAPNGNVVFGGSFSGLGNTTTPTKKDQQVINLSTARVTAGSTTNQAGFNDPANIVCKTEGEDSAGNTWLVGDNRPGYWQANMAFGYQPTMLRLWNTNQDGRGTRTFRYTALPLNGILNLTYTDPQTGEPAYCDARCPLAHNTSAQEFHFVDVVGMNGFRVDISDWYGNGAGLDGIELVQDDIYAYAVNDFNEPACAGTSFASAATRTGSWGVTPSGQSQSDYLTAVVDPSNASSTDVVFEPDIKQAGNYSVTIFTPGCLQTDSCQERGQVNVTGLFAATGSQANQPSATTIFQTNSFDKYDNIFMGYVDAASDSFRPAVTLSPVAGSSNNMQIVASRVRFELLDSTGGLNGLFEFNPNVAVVDTDFASSAINRAGTDLDTGATVTALTTVGDTIFAAGDFSDTVFQNIMSFSDNRTQSLASNGLNAPVNSIFSFGDLLYIGGNFTDTSTPSTRGLNSVAAYSPGGNGWAALGQGVNGVVNTVVPLQLNVTQDRPETTITFSGAFTQISAFDNFDAIDVDGFAIWVPSQQNWIQNLNSTRMALAGQLSAFANVSGSAPLLAGTLSSQGLAASGAVSLAGSDEPSISRLPINIQSTPAQNPVSKRALSAASGINGVVTGAYYDEAGRNVTILAGHFSAEATNGSPINNILFIDGSNKDAVTGFAPGVAENSTVAALAIQSDTLFAGGAITGEVSGSDVNGLVLYNLRQATFVSPQPPSLAGENVSVNAISVRPRSTQVFVGGDFASAGSLGCPSVCVFDTSTAQWARPGTGLSGVISSFMWSSANTLIAAGNLSVAGNASAVVSYDVKRQTWSSSIPLSAVPGPVRAMTAASNNAANYWISGISSNGSTYIMNVNGRNMRTIGETLGENTNVRGLQILDLTKNHDDSDLLANNQVLLVAGQLDLHNFGSASAALFNGTNFEPFILATSGNGDSGSLSQLVSSKTPKLSGPRKFLFWTIADD